MSLLDFGGAAAYGTALQPMQMEQQGQQFGLEQGQRQAQVNALQGVDLNNPASIDAGITKLIHANSFDQANALMGLNATRTIYGSILPMVAQKLSGASPQQTSQPQTAQTSPDANSPEFAQAHSDIMGQAQQAVQQLQQTPVADRPALAAQIKQKFVGMGVPEAAVDAELDDLSDAGLAKVSQHYQDHTQWMQGGGQAGPAPQSPTNYDWAMKAIQDPNLNNPFVQAAMKKVGFDIEPYMARAQAVAQPFVNKAAELQYAAPLAEAAVPAHLGEKLGESQIQAGYAGPIAAATAAGSKAGAAPGTIVEIPMGDGSTQKGTFTPGPDGNYVFRPIQAAAGSGSGGTVGRTLTPGQEHTQTTQAQQAADYLKPNPEARTAAQAALDNSQRILSIVSSMKVDPTTPLRGQIANALRVAGVKGADQVASEIADLDGAMKQGTAAGLHSIFPQRITDSDLRYGSAAFGGLTNPNDRLKVAWGLNAATAMRNANFEDFKANYDGPKDNPQAIQRAWLAKEGNQSFYQSPVWAHITVTGKDNQQHVLFDPSQDILNVGGKRVGVWGGWTNHPVTFPVK